MKYIISVFVLFWFFSCENEKDFTISNGQKLVFKYLNSDDTSRNDIFYNKHGNFWIENPQGLTNFINAIGDKMDSKTANSAMIYKITVFDGKESEVFGFYDIKNEKIRLQNPYLLKTSELESLSNYFVDIIDSKVKFGSISGLM